jgi:hypothetical protein
MGWLSAAALSFSLLVLGCGSSSGGSSGGGGTGHAFACGSTTCNSATQYCSIVTGGAVVDGGTNTSAGCASFDGGKGCPGGSSATSPGQCGCYESPSGEVTITECVP